MRAFRTIGRNSSTWRLKKTLAALVVLGAASYLTVGGAFAIFNGTVTDAGSTVASGTFTLADAVNSGTACYSYGSGSTGNANPGCSALFTNTTLRFPGQAFTTSVTIQNNGSQPAQDLVLYMPTCSSTTSPSAAFVGGTGLCSSGSDLEMYVQETTTSGTTCWYPSLTGSSCSSSTPGWASFYNFVSNAYDVSDYLDLGSGPAAGATRTFTIGFMLPSTAASTEQGEEADFALTWHAQTTP